MIKSSLIVLNYNDSATTANLVKSVKSYNTIDKIIIVDNNSSDDSKEKLSTLVDEKIDFIQSKENRGYAYGNNYGIKYAVEKYKPTNIIIANPDVYIEEVVLEKLITFLEENNDVAIATATMKNLTKEGYTISPLKAWKRPSYIYSLFTALFICSKFSGRLIKYNDKYFNGEYSEVFAVQGSFFVVKADVLKEINYLDEETFLYCEEMILGSKISDKGYKEVVFNNLYYNHDHGVTINKNINKKINKYKILNESLSIYMKKYLKVGRIKLSLFKMCCHIGITERRLVYFFMDKMNS
ncbi:glycosyltransferase [Clostridium massiliamazoniense]|uniref:glycosyltransferase n=1 Tax=Clostridium massiliamazoniense TaxID=1347366 RepID=UPI0006D8178C|nr:glycosyltransferase family 2 protein [Clostridium massiliamazoniense]